MGQLFARRRLEVGYGATMAEVVERRDLTAPEQNGWAVDYRIRRDDVEELHAEVRCWERAHRAAERAATGGVTPPCDSVGHAQG